MRGEHAAAPLADLAEDQRQLAMARFAVLRPTLEDGVPLTRTAAQADVPLRTAQRWLARFRRDGLAGLTRTPRRDLSAFAVVAQVERMTGSDGFAAIRGLGRRAPGPAAALALALLSLAGVPPQAGFAGKVIQLVAAIEGGFAWLAVRRPG